MNPIETKQTYQDYVDKKSPNSPIFKNCFNAFWVGGLICTIGQIIMNICKEYNIGINTFIKEIIGNKKNPELTRKVFNISDEKIYLGKQKQISNELIEKIYLTKDKTIEKLAIVIAQMYGRLNNFEDLKQEVYLKLIENGGKIETNLSYDQN